MERDLQAFTLLLIVIGLVSGCASSGPAAAPSEPLSVEDELINRSIEAQGGHEALTSINTSVMTGTAVVQGMELPLTIYAKRPNLSRRIVEVPQMGMEIVSAFDGEVAWELNPMMGMSPRKLGEERTRLEAHNADIDGDLVGYKDKGNIVSYEGEEEIAGGTAHKLVITRPDASVVTYYVDTETMLPVRMDGEGIDGQTGAKVNQQTVLSDYREVHGVMMPMKLEINSGGTNLSITIEEASINEGIEDAVFAFPEGE